MDERISHLPIDVLQLVDSIHGTKGKIALVVTGAGVQATYWLFARPGASKTMLDAYVPYSSDAVIDFLGSEPEQYVSCTTAQFMAERALVRARQLSAAETEPENHDSLLAGVSCTAAIATDRTRRGENRCDVAFATSDGRGAVASLVMAKGERDRSAEESVVSRLILNAVAEAKHVDQRVDVPLLNEEQLSFSRFDTGKFD